MDQKSRKGWDAFPYLLLSPALLMTALVIFYPIVRTITYSLMQYILWKPTEIAFVGFRNYINAAKDPVFWISLKNTLLWIAGVISLQLVLGFCTALLLNQRFFYRGLARSLVLIPWVTPSVITALMWRWMYDGNRGVINDLLVRAGVLTSYFPWLANDKTALFAIIVALMWQGFPFFAIMILAGLQAIPETLYEAAEVDGANGWYKFTRITVPLLVPVLFTSLMLRIIWVANSLDIIYVMTGGGPGYATHTLPVYSYIKAYKGMDFGYASTIAVALTILITLFVAIYVRKVISVEDRGVA